jgi:hypothetical protein
VKVVNHKIEDKTLIFKVMKLNEMEFKKMKPIEKTKKKILDKIEGVKEFEVSWIEEVAYGMRVKAKNEKEVEEMFYGGKIIPTDEDISESSLTGELEIYELED